MILSTFPVGFGKNCFKSTGPETTPHHAGLISCHGEPLSQCHAGWKFDEKGNITRQIHSVSFLKFLKQIQVAFFWTCAPSCTEPSLSWRFLAPCYGTINRGQADLGRPSGDSCDSCGPTWHPACSPVTHGQGGRKQHRRWGLGSFGIGRRWLFYMGVEPKIGVFTPQIINFNRVFHCKPSILGYPYFLETPIFSI